MRILNLLCLVVATVAYTPRAHAEGDTVNPVTSFDFANLSKNGPGHAIGPVMPVGLPVDCTVLVPKPLNVPPCARRRRSTQ